MASLDELKKKFKDKETSHFAIFICVFMAIFLVILVLYIIYHNRIIRDLVQIIKARGKLDVLKDTFSDESTSDQSSSAANIYDIKLLLKSIVVIITYGTIFYYSLKGLLFLQIMLLLPCILFITLPFILRYFLKITSLPSPLKRMFRIESIPTENPVVTFIFFIVTINLWYVFSASVDEKLFSADAKALSINISVVLIFLYILYKHYYKFSTSDALLRAIGLTGASAIFMMSAPMYVYMPIAR